MPACQPYDRLNVSRNFLVITKIKDAKINFTFAIFLINLNSNPIG